MATALIPLAEGCEELEAVTVIDILRRAGVEVLAVGLQPGPVRCSRGVVLLPDTDLAAVAGRSFDAVVLPGGLGGTERLEADQRILALLREQVERGAWTAAICAAPRVLQRAGVLAGHTVTAYPGILDDATDVTVADSAAVLRDGCLLTSRGPGTALDFALELAELLCGPTVRQQVEAGLARPQP